jgi:hypothetical protein
MEYGCVLFYENENIHTATLENIQYQAGLIVCGALSKTSYSKLLIETGWPRLSERVKYLKATIFYKGVNELMHPYFTSLINQRCLRSGDVTISLRNRDRLAPPFCKTERYLNSFIPSSCKLWLNIAESIRGARSVNAFKYHYKAHYFNKIIPDIDRGERRSNFLHARFRLGFTTLNSDLFQRSRIDSPICRCRYGPETYGHFFSHCSLYNNQREILMRHQSDLTKPNLMTDLQLLNLILYGFDNIDTIKHNSALFLLVQQYIESTKRFQLL